MLYNWLTLHYLIKILL